MNPRFTNRVVSSFLAVFLLFGVLSAGFHNHAQQDAQHSRSACAVCLLHSNFSHGLTFAAVSVPEPINVISSEAAFFEYIFSLPPGRPSSRLSRGPPAFRS